MHKYPDHVFDFIQVKGFTIKETYSPEYFLCDDFKSVKDPKSNNYILILGSKTYDKCMMDNFKNSFSFEPSKQHADMPPNYKPDLKITDIYNDANNAKYWQCIGELQWSVALCCINIIHDTIVLSWFCYVLCKGHLAKV